MRDDLISRQAAIDAIDVKNVNKGIILALQSIIWELPSAQPERKSGRWIELTNTNHTYVCSVCGRMLINITDGKNTVTKNYPFCHCGADMRGEQDEAN